jgi:hypothetical protein
LNEESSTFFDDDLLPNRNLYQNFRHLLTELRDITCNMTYRKIEKTLTEKAVNLIKDKIKGLGSDILKRLKRQGKSIARANPDDPTPFPSALGKYVKSKNIPLAIQEEIFSQISEDEQDLYNCVYLDYLKSKRKLGGLDERIETHT